MTVVEKAKPRGRPRAFDRETVVERAMQVFWAAGYEGASIPILTVAMGISAQSLYAAFGSKEALYRETIEHYRSTIGGFAAQALNDEGDAIDAVARLLQDAAVTFSRTAGTPGCMIATPGAAEPPLARLGCDLRREGVDKVAERLARGIREGQVCPSADCANWANYVGTVVQGMSIAAGDGATAEQLLSTATIATQPLSSLRP